MKRVHLELGGKAPVVVFDDADVGKLVETLKFAGYTNTGQDCTASCRVVAGAGIYDDLLAELVPAVESIKVGDIDDETVEMGPLVSERQRESVAGFVDRAQATGAKVLTGGEEIDGAGLLLQADRRDRRRPEGRDHPAARSSVRSSRCSGSPTRTRRSRGRTTSTTGWRPRCGRRTRRGPLRVARRLQFGAVWINTHFMISPEMPHGGYKQSGYGKDMSMYSLEDYTQIKHVMAVARLSGTADDAVGVGAPWRADATQPTRKVVTA